MLVSALEAEKVLREQARTECTKEDNDFESKMTAAELHEVLRNVIDSVEKACPEPDRASGTSVRSKSHAGPDKRQGQATARTEKPKPDRKTNKGSQAQEDREPKDGGVQSPGLRRRQRWLHDLGRRSDALQRKGSIRTNKPLELAMVTGEDFDRHFSSEHSEHMRTHLNQQRSWKSIRHTGDNKEKCEHTAQLVPAEATT